MQAKFGSYELVFGFLCHTKRVSYDRLFVSYRLGMRIRTQKRAKDTRANLKREHESGSELPDLPKASDLTIASDLPSLKEERAGNSSEIETENERPKRAIQCMKRNGACQGSAKNQILPRSTWRDGCPVMGGNCIFAFINAPTRLMARKGSQGNGCVFFWIGSVSGVRGKLLLSG